MATTFHCACGKKLQVSADSPGKSVRCPACKELLYVPRRAAGGRGALVCGCGEEVTADGAASARPVHCPQCRRLLAVPAGEAPAADGTATPSGPFPPLPTPAGVVPPPAEQPAGGAEPPKVPERTSPPTPVSVPTTPPEPEPAPAPAGDQAPAPAAPPELAGSGADLAEVIRANTGGVTVRGQTFDGPVDLSCLTFDHPLTLEGCTFRGRFDARDAHFKKSVNLTGCTFRDNVDFAGARVDGTLVLDLVTILPGDRPLASFKMLRVQGDVRARSLTAGDWADLPGDDPAAPPPDEPELFARLQGGAGKRLDLDFTGARVEGDFALSSSRARVTRCLGDIGFVNAKIWGNLEMVGVLVTGGMYMQLALVEGHVNCSPLAEANPAGGRTGIRWATVGRSVTLDNCEVAGSINFIGARVGVAAPAGAADPCLSLQCAEVEGGLFCRSDPETGYRSVLAGPVWLAGASVSGTADFDGSEIRGFLTAEGAVIDGSLFCRRKTPRGAPTHPTEIRGDVVLVAAKVTGLADFSGSSVDGDLSLRWAELGRGLRCSSPAADSRTLIRGKVDLAEARSSGEVSFDGARIGYPLPAAAQADGQAAPQPAQPPDAADQADVVVVDAGRAKLSAGLSLRGAQLRGGLSLVGAEVLGDLTCSPWGDDPIQVEGTVNLNGARVSGEANFDRAALGHRLAEEQRLALKDRLDTPKKAHEVEEKVKAAGQQLGRDMGPNLAELLGAQGLTAEARLERIRAATRGLGEALGRQWAGHFGNSDRAEKMVDILARAVGGELANFVDREPAWETQKELARQMKAALYRLTGVRALSCERADVGKFNLADARLYGQLYFGSAHVRGGLFDISRRVKDAQVSGEVDLRNCSVGDLQLYFTPMRHQEDGPAGGRPRPAFPKILLEGCHFQELHVHSPPEEGKESLPPDSGGAYERLPEVLQATDFPVGQCVVIESWLRDRGEGRAADRLYLRMMDNKSRKMTRFRRLGYRFWKLSTGYGLQKHLWAIPGLVLLAAFSLLTFLNADAVRPVAPAVAPAAPGGPVDPPGAGARPWNTPEAVALSLHTVIPVFHPRTADYWKSSEHPAHLFGLCWCWFDQRGEVLWGSYADWEVIVTLLAGALWSLLGWGLLSGLLKDRMENRLKSGRQPQ